jgi:hypothetical protein
MCLPLSLTLPSSATVRLYGHVRQLARALDQSRSKLQREQELRRTLQRQLRDERDDNSPRSHFGLYAGLGAPGFPSSRSGHSVLLVLLVLSRSLIETFESVQGEQQT